MSLIRFKNKIYLLTAFLMVFSLVNASSSLAESARASIKLEPSKRSPGFEVPETLRRRVNFWTDVFTKYGKYQLIVHHRRFPQIVFKVLDFSKAAENLSPAQLSVLRNRIEEEKVQEVEGYLRNLIRNGRPSNSIEEYIARQMDFLPGGVQKYQDVIDNEWVRTQTGIKEKYAEAVRRTGRYLGSLEQIFTKENNLPVELTRLPFIESSFDYTAYSSVGAAGIWQFMRGTAKKYMTVGPFIDERLDPIVATRAAAQYLKGAYSSLGSWPMAVTSYNHGVAGVYHKMKDAGTTDIASVIERPNGEPVFGFASSNFFPEFLAAVEIYEDYQKHFPGLDLAPPMRVRDYRVSRPIVINQIAHVLGIEKDDLVAANYALLPPVASGKRPIPAGYTLRIPLEASGSMEKLDTLVADAPKEVTAVPASSVYGGNTYTVRKGDTVLSIAKKYRTSVDELVKSNHLSAKTVRVGQKLFIHSVATDSTSSEQVSKRNSTRERSEKKALKDTQLAKSKKAAAVKSGKKKSTSQVSKKKSKKTSKKSS